MISRYGIFCKVVETGSFTKAAVELGYSQSAISQSVKALEKELGTVLLKREKGGLTLSRDGMQFFPYLQSIYTAEEALARKQAELEGLQNDTIRIGTFVTVSRFLLPKLMKGFREQYPKVRFVLKQGDYNSIEQWILEDAIDFGFINPDAVYQVETYPLLKQHLLAALPKGHPLAAQKVVTLAQMADYPLILPDEGEFNLLLRSFKQARIQPNIAYKVYDDYSILSMIQQGLGISGFYDIFLNRIDSGLEIREIEERPERTLSLAWHHRDTLPLAARRFIDFVIKHNKEGNLF